MDVLIPLAVAVPLLGAAVAMLASALAGPRVVNALALAVAAGTTGVAAALLVTVSGRTGPAVYWFAGLDPHGKGVPLGIDFVVGPLAAGTATFAALLVTVALVASFRYVAAGGAAFAALVLLFQGAMVGFALSGDLFDIFVFFELMTAAGIALAAFGVRQRGPLGGGLSMAVSNSVGAFLVLTGIALVYGETGALNLQQIGNALGHGPPGPAALVGFGLIVCGFLVKAAAVPFHFWLADTYSTAPAPVCLLFSGIMSELGLYAIARIHWAAFAAALGPGEESLRAVLVALGALTAVVGAVMCLFQRHLKRMLAFITTSFIGLFLIGVGLLDRKGLGGAAVYVLADGMLKASLFMAVGAIQQRHGSVDQRELHGRGRTLRVAGPLFVIGALGLAAVPPFGPFVGKALIEEAGGELGYAWLPAVFIFAEAVTGGAVLAAAARVFLGWGSRWEDDEDGEGEEEGGEEQEGEETEARGRRPLAAVAAALMAGAFAVGFIPDLALGATHAAGTFALHSLPESMPAPEDIAAISFPGRAYAYAGASTLGAVLVAWLALSRPVGLSLPVLVRPLSALRGLHSGHDGEYLAWITVGVTAVTAAFTILLRG